jgi:hypothetical protein
MFLCLVSKVLQKYVNVCLSEKFVYLNDLMYYVKTTPDGDTLTTDLPTLT